MDVVVVAERMTVLSLPPPPPPRGRSRLALAVGDAVLCLCVADFFLHAAAVAARDLGRIAFDEQCFLVSAAASFASVSSEFMLGALGAVFVVFASRMGFVDSDDSKVADAGKLEAAGREVMPPLMQWMWIIGSFFFLTIAAVGDLLKDSSPVKGSAMEQIGSVFSVVGILGLDALCFVVIPIVALRLWRVTRPGWRCNAGAEIENP